MIGDSPRDWRQGEDLHGEKAMRKQRGKARLVRINRAGL